MKPKEKDEDAATKSPELVAPGEEPREAESAESVQAPEVTRDSLGRFRAGSAVPPRRRAGGQPHNLNRARAPWQSLWKHGRVKSEWKAIVTRLASTYDAEMAAHLGGPDAATFPERRLAEIARTSAVCSGLILVEAGRSGFFALDKEGRRDLAPCLKELPRFAVIEQKALLALGLKRKPKELETFAQLLARKAAEEAAAQEQPLDVEAQAQQPEPGDLEPGDDQGEDEPEDDEDEPDGAA